MNHHPDCLKFAFEPMHSEGPRMKETVLRFWAEQKPFGTEIIDLFFFFYWFYLYTFIIYCVLGQASTHWSVGTWHLKLLGFVCASGVAVDQLTLEICTIRWCETSRCLSLRAKLRHVLTCESYQKRNQVSHNHQDVALIIPHCKHLSCNLDPAREAWCRFSHMLFYSATFNILLLTGSLCNCKSSRLIDFIMTAAATLVCHLLGNSSPCLGRVCQALSLAYKQMFAPVPPSLLHEICMCCINEPLYVANVVFLRSAPPGSKFFSIKCTPSVQYRISPPAQETSHLSPIALNDNTMLLISMDSPSKHENDNKVKRDRKSWQCYLPPSLPTYWPIYAV